MFKVFNHSLLYQKQLKIEAQKSNLENVDMEIVCYNMM